MTVEQKVEQNPSWIRDKFVRFNLWTRDRWMNLTTVGVLAGLFHPVGWSLAIIGGVGTISDQVTASIADNNGAIERKRAQEMGLTTSWWDRFRGSLRFFNSSPKLVRASSS